MISASATLPKSERLSGKTAIDALVSNGKWGICGHIRFCWAPTDAENSRILVSVPKKFFKRAVKRNLLKRRIREAYRLQKGLNGSPKDILFSYQGGEVADFATIRDEMAEILKSL